jgi:anhydro-N-acetylmuramic acid kinase
MESNRSGCAAGTVRGAARAHLQAGTKAAMEASDMKGELYIGIMTGTSLDGVDAVLADLSGPAPREIGHAHHGLTGELRRELLLLASAGWDELHRAAVAAQHLARAFALAVDELLHHADVEAQAVRAIGVHGQTVRHRPDAGYTIQLNAPAQLAELTGIDVVADFRSRDVAAGGQGAPLVPAFHAGLFTTQWPRAVVNIGGISNLTGLPAAGGTQAVTGFDCGPGNVLIDAWATEHLKESFDRDGAWGGGGHTSATLLDAMLQEPFLELAPPKSTGRELFNRQWLAQKIAQRALAPRDVQATLTRFTAACIGRAVERFLADADEVLVCGGGAFNATLMRMLAEECAPRPVQSTAQLGIAPDRVEALAFAWLAREHVLRRAASLPAVTGARGARILGAMYPGG